MHEFLGHVQKRLDEEGNQRASQVNYSQNDYGEMFMETNAEEIYKKLGNEIGIFMTEWNNDPRNRSKAAQLFINLQNAHNMMLDAQ